MESVRNRVRATRRSALRSADILGKTIGVVVGLFFAPAALRVFQLQSRFGARRRLDQRGRRSVAGRWDGRWLSEANGHHGNLRCLMTRESEERCQARFSRDVRRRLSFQLHRAADLAAARRRVGTQREANLGKLAGGAYYY